MLVTLHDRHPLWSIIRMAVLGTILVGTLKVTASSFDQGEIAAATILSLSSLVFDTFKRARAKKE